MAFGPMLRVVAVLTEKPPWAARLIVGGSLSHWSTLQNAAPNQSAKTTSVVGEVVVVYNDIVVGLPGLALACSQSILVRTGVTEFSWKNCKSEWCKSRSSPGTACGTHNGMNGFTVGTEPGRIVFHTLPKNHCTHVNSC